MGNLRPARRTRTGLLLFVLALATLVLAAAAGSVAPRVAAASSGLVAAYSFDEGSGTTLTDVSGNANDGTLANATWATGHSGGALKFNGTSAYVTVPDAASLDLTSSMTLEAWVYPTATPAGYGAILAKDRTGGGLPYGLESDQGTPDSYVNAGARATADAASALPLNTWTHLATVYDGSALRLYVNGVQVASVAASGTLVNSSNPLRIGADLTWGEYFAGKIDDVRIYNRALTASAVQTDMNTAVTLPSVSGAVAAYAFDAGTGTTAADASGSGNTAALTATAWTVGHSGSALSFNGSSSYATVADNASLDFSGGVTLEAWVLPLSTAGWDTIVAKERTGGGLPYGLELANGVPDGYVNTGSNATAAAATPLPANVWTHLAMTYDGATVRLYVNGSDVADTPATGSVVASTGPLRIGADLTWGEYFTGSIDDVRAYGRALSPTEIVNDMNTPVSPPPAPPPAPADTQSPTAPTGLAATGTTTTSISVAWTASTDNVGVAGYDVLRNGSALGTTTATQYAYTGLSCGTRYTLAVDAFDAAGNKSAATSISASTAACPSTTASTFVSPSGSDANACTQSAPCLSFDRAYQVAQPGQTVQVAGGTYGDQDIRWDQSKAGSTSDVTFAPAAGATVSIGDLVFGASMSTRGASHVTVQNMTVRGDIQVMSCGAGAGQQCLDDSQSGGTYITFRNLVVQGPVGFYCASCGHVSFFGGVVGPKTYGSPCNGSNHPEVQNIWDSSLSSNRKLKRSHDLLIDGTTWQNFSACTSTDHTECLQIEPADNVTIRNSIFRRCDTITVNLANDLAGDSVSAAGYRAPNNVLIENNFFDKAWSLPGANTYYALNIRECTNCTIRYNSWLQGPRLPTGEIAKNVAYIGNVGPMQQWDCGTSGVTWSHNVWVGAQCVSSDRNVSDPIFANPSTVDLHLRDGSPAIDAGDPSSYPTKDIDGQARPLGSAPDAGADEHA